MVPGSFNKLSGTFVVPIAGTYFFQFTAQCHSKESCQVDVHVNGAIKYHFMSDSGGNSGDERQLTAIWWHTLTLGDEIRIKMAYDQSIFVTSDQALFFTGVFIQ